jgi:cytochrome b6-f complex iron-sulfur subunit
VRSIPKEYALGEDRVPRREFIRLGAAVGLGVASSSVLAACGGSGGGESGQQSGGNNKQKASGEASTTTSPTVGKGDPIVDAAFIPAGFAFSFNVAETGKPAMVVHLPDESWVAYETQCTHLGCEVSYQLETQRVGCPCHGSVFNPAQGGAVVNGPAKRPLKEIKVRTEGGKVVLA